MIFTGTTKISEKKDSNRIRETLIDKTSFKRENLLEILTDEKNKDFIDLCDANGRKQSFKQIATVPMGEKLYCILKPLTQFDDHEMGESIVFKLEDMGQGTHALLTENNEKKSLKVFLVYYKMLFDSIKGSDMKAEEKSQKLNTIKALASEYRTLLKADK